MTSKKLLSSLLALSLFAPGTSFAAVIESLGSAEAPIAVEISRAQCPGWLISGRGRFISEKMW